jgi:hypothetical protein
MKRLVIVLLAGCQLGGRHSTGPQSRVVDRTLGPAVVIRSDPVQVSAVARDAAVVVTAVVPRVCRREVHDTVGIFESRRSRRVVAATIDRPCDVPAAGVRVHLTLASGTVVDGTTDERGEFALPLPDGEPAGAVSAVAASP